MRWSCTCTTGHRSWRKRLWSSIRSTPELWNTLGDSLIFDGAQGRGGDGVPLGLAVELPANVRGRYNLVYTLTDKGDLTGALKMIAEALASDKAVSLQTVS